MKTILSLFLAVLSVQGIHAQQPKKTGKKYQGLLWEISGNGLSKPSYLFGTMHVSSKLAFHLSDSFYYAIKSADMVALETNPAHWQDDFTRQANFSEDGAQDYSYNRYASSFPSGYFHENTFAFKSYEEAIPMALSAEPSMINGMLYRTYNYMADYEEDTYLDMYIFQTGSKLGKKMGGVEDFDESEKLVKEAYKDAAKDLRKNGYKEEEPEESEEEDEEAKKNKKPYTIQDAYRKGDLDFIDSLDSRGSRYQSKAFLEKFLYKRNEIQAKSIDTILKKKIRLFVGVGCAHLPGKRGVIEMLREMGYKLRPVQMGDRDGRQKDEIDKIRVPVTFNTVFAEDSTFSVSIPGKKFYNFSSPGMYSSVQFAEMKNGAYYLVTRIKTNAAFLGDGEDKVLRRVDSFLYENIPGKILSKTAINKNGYKGYAITNKTRRGDVQRYNIYITPFEILIFKVSGIGEYILKGTEADQFLNSVTFHIDKPGQDWKNYMPAHGGFAVKMPHTPVMLKDAIADRLEYWSRDEASNTTYGLLQTNIVNMQFIEEDTFDLSLMDLSFASSENIDKQVSRKQIKWQNYPGLETRYSHKDGSTSDIRFLLKGPVYYAQVAHYKKPTESVKQFFESFSIQPVKYNAPKTVIDTSAKITVSSPIYPDLKPKEDEPLNSYDYYYGGDDDEIDEDEKVISYTRLVGNDTTGEKIYVSYFRTPKSNLKDTAEVFGRMTDEEDDNDFWDNRMIYHKKDSGYTSNGFKYYEYQFTDTNSIKTIYSKLFYKNGNYISVYAIGDTVSGKSSLLKNFFQTIRPSDSIKAYKTETVKPNKKFFNDFASKDSATHARALAKMTSIDFDSTDVPALKKIIDTLSWKSKNYLELKKDFIGLLDSDSLKDPGMVAYLRNLYGAVKDTADLQNTILNTLLNMQTGESFNAFKDLITNEPPAIVETGSNDYSYTRTKVRRATTSRKVPSYLKKNYGYDYDGDNESSITWWQLQDTVKLAKTVMPEILQLINLDDYKQDVMDYLSMMVDSGQVTGKDYEALYTKFYVEARQMLKKQRAAERQADIEKAEKENAEEKKDIYGYGNYGYNNEGDDKGNDELDQYATLLIPFWDKNPGVPVFFNDMLKLKSDRLKLNTMVLMMKNNRPVPDSLPEYFAADIKKRIGLYSQLKEAKMENKFPAKYKSQQQLVESAIAVQYAGEEKYDTIAYLDTLQVTYKNKPGIVYFYKYKSKKEDKKWRIASFGMQPADAKVFDDENDEFTSSTSSGYSYNYGNNDEDEVKLDEKKPVKEQLQKMLQKMLFKKRSSAKEFYQPDYRYRYNEYLKYAAPKR